MRRCACWGAMSGSCGILSRLRWSRVRSRCLGLVCGCCPLAGAGPAARLCCWIACAGRAGAAVPWRYHDASPAEGAAGAPRTAFALHVGQPGETGVRVPGDTRSVEAVGRLPHRATARHGPVERFVGSACGSWLGRSRCSVFWLSALARHRNGRATGSTQSLTTPATAVPSFVESGSAEGAARCCHGAGQHRFSHLAAPCDAARLHQTPS